MDPKQLQRLLRQMGIKAREIEVREVVFVLSDGSRWVFRKPQVVETTMMGQRAFQVVGKPREEVSEEDIKIVMEKTGVDEVKAREALERAGGDIAEAIILLQESQ